MMERVNHVSGGDEYVQPGHPPMRIIGLFFIWEMLNIPAGSKQELGSELVTVTVGDETCTHTYTSVQTHAHTRPTCVLFLLPTHSGANDLQQLLL